MPQWHFFRPTRPRVRGQELRASQRADWSTPFLTLGCRTRCKRPRHFLENTRVLFYPALNEDANSPVGAVIFKWVASKGSPAGLTNLSSPQARALFQAGSEPLALFTGNASDTTSIYAAGRDPDSGTRLTALAEIGQGLGAQPVTQYQPTNSSNAAVSSTTDTITSLIVTPAETVDGVPISTGTAVMRAAAICPRLQGRTTRLVNTSLPILAQMMLISGSSSRS